jgi:hypothetical protein
MLISVLGVPLTREIIDGQHGWLKGPVRPADPEGRQGGELHLNRLATIEIDGRKERLLRFVSTDQNRGEKEGEGHGGGSAGME